MLRALQVRPTTQMLSDILSRLVETVAEQGEDMQGYVTEIMLTLEAFVDNLDLEFRPIDFMRELFMSTPNLAKDQVESNRRSAIICPKQQHSHHARSTSYSASVFMQRAHHISGRGGGRLPESSFAVWKFCMRSGGMITCCVVLKFFGCMSSGMNVCCCSAENVAAPAPPPTSSP